MFFLDGLVEHLCHGPLSISAYNRLTLVRALNQGLRQIVTVLPQEPLAGGHDPAAEVQGQAGQNPVGQRL